MNRLFFFVFVLCCVLICCLAGRTQVQLFRCKGTEPFVCEGVHGLTCISPFSFCDAKPDCLDGEDEKNCQKAARNVRINSFNPRNYVDYDTKILPNLMMMYQDDSDQRYNFMAAYLATLADFSTSSNNHVNDIINYLSNSLSSYEDKINKGALNLQ